MISFPMIELVDRYAIAVVKHRRTAGANQTELMYYQQQIEQFDLSLVRDSIEKLQQVHDEIWELEKELKSGQEHKLPLEEIGRRAIMIRNKNNVRVGLKNSIADQLGCQVTEIKRDHISE